MAEDTNDVTCDPVTGRLTIRRPGTYRISAPLVNAGPSAVERVAYLEAALLTIASQDWPDGMKAWQYAQLTLWGPLCYWCRGFDKERHPGAWTGCACRGDEPWD